MSDTVSECKVSKVIRKHNRESAEREAADKLARMLEELLAVHEQVTFGISGQKDVGDVLELLAEKDINWSRVHIFLTDEVFVPIEQSNYSLIQKHLVDNRSCTLQEETHPDWDHEQCIPSENVHRFEIEEGIEVYKKKLLTIRPQYDLLLLSSGEDGSIAGLFPHHDAFTRENALFVEYENSLQPPERRMSMSREHVKKAHGAVVLFFGEKKRQAVRNFQVASENDCPAKLVNYTEHAYAITDLG